MANLTPNEYFQAQFSDPKWVLIKAVRVDSPNTNWKKTVQPIVWLVKKDKKHAEFVSLWTNSYEADGTTYKKNTAPQQGYFQFNFTFEFSKSKDEMETFIADSVMQNEMIIQALSKEAGITDGPWSITQDPWDPNVVPKRLRPDTEPVAATGPSASTTENKSVTTTEPTVATSSVGASASNVGATASILGEFTFNVEQDNTFIGVNNQFGTLYTIGIGEIKEEPLAKPEEGEILEAEGLDEEYQEETYVESSDKLITDDIIRNVDQTEAPVVYGPVTNNGSAASTGVGSTDNLKPTKKGYLQGSSFKNTIQSGGWNQKVDTKYVLTGFKFGKPTITEKTFVARVKKAEGGIFNDTADNAYKTYGMDTVCPISKNDKAYNKKYASLCTTGKNRLYNIHTNKGITYIVFKAAFGIKKDQDGSIDVQERYLKMSDDDWWKVMKGLYYDPNKGGQIKSKIASYFWVYMCWGSGSAGAVGNLNNALNMLKGSTVFNGGISNSHINYMNELYDQGKEDTLISAMYDARIQKLLNISQPDNTNKKYRNGWVNGINNWITDFHES